MFARRIGVLFVLLLALVPFASVPPAQAAAENLSYGLYAGQTFNVYGGDRTSLAIQYADVDEAWIQGDRYAATDKVAYQICPACYSNLYRSDSQFIFLASGKRLVVTRISGTHVRVTAQ